MKVFVTNSFIFTPCEAAHGKTTFLCFGSIFSEINTYTVWCYPEVLYNAVFSACEAANGKSPFKAFFLRRFVYVYFYTILVHSKNHIAILVFYFKNGIIGISCSIAMHK